MAQKHRTVYFFDPVVVDRNDEVKPVEADAWASIHAALVEAEESARQMEFFGRRHVGQALKAESPAVDYVYIGRLRPGADWPDVAGHDGDIASLASTGFQGNLIEPAYLLGVPGTNFIALLRSSAGPSTSAIEYWLNHALGFVHTEDRLELRPYVRRDQLERLKLATSASKLMLRVEANAFAEAEPQDEIGKALKAAQDVGSGGVEVELTVSFGRVRATDGAGQAMAKELKKAFRSPWITGMKKGEATLSIPDEEKHEVRTEKIDFHRDRVTVRQAIGEDENQIPTPAIILHAMNQAITKFKSQINS